MIQSCDQSQAGLIGLVYGASFCRLRIDNLQGPFRRNQLPGDVAYSRHAHGMEHQQAINYLRQEFFDSICPKEVICTQ